MVIELHAEVTCNKCLCTEKIVFQRLAYARTEIEMTLRNLGWFAEDDTLL